MYNVRESWTDARLDDFAGHVDKRFDAVDKRLDRIDDRLESMQRLMLQSSVAVIVALIALIATQL
jgi:hypothetical protein